MEMTPGEIKRNYDSAKSKSKQIKILADLNGCSQDEIKKIITMETQRESKQTNMFTQEQKPVSQEPPATELSLNEMRNILFKRLDELEEEIKVREEEYRRITVTVDVLGKMEDEYGKNKAS